MPRRLKSVALQLVLFVLLAVNIEMYCFLHLPAEAPSHFGQMPSFLNDGALCQYDGMRGWRLRRDIPGCSVNLDGLRGGEVTVPRPSDEIRILCLGSSVTWGWGLGDTQTYPALLQQRLALDGRMVTVINGGTPGFTSENCAAMLMELAPRYRPQIVTLMIGFNEPWVQQRAREMRLASDPQTDWLRALLHKSYAYQYLYHTVETTRSPEPVLTAEKRWEVSADNVRLICELMRELDFHLLIVWEARRSWASLQQGAHEGNDFTLLRDPTSVQKLRGEVMAVARQFDVPVLDMDEQFKRSGLTEDELFQSTSGAEKFKYMHDPVHPTLRGSMYIAETLATTLNELGWVRPGP